MNGTESWQKHNDLNKYFFNDSTLKHEPNINCMNNRYECGVSGSASSYNTSKSWVQSVSQYPRIYIHDDNYSSVNDFKTYLQSNNVIGQYVLLNEQTTNLKLPNIDLSKTKYINIETNTNPSSIELDYVK